MVGIFIFSQIRSFVVLRHVKEYKKLTSLKFLLAVLLFLIAPDLKADVVSHLRKMNYDNAPSGIDGIDCIYMINLDERPEKWKASISQLKPYGLKIRRLSAVNGWTLSNSTLEAIGVKYQPGMRTDLLGTRFDKNKRKITERIFKHKDKAYFTEDISLGAIGCALSHLSVLLDAYKKNYDTIWVMEDDILVVDHPKKLARRVKELDALVGSGNWDILFTDTDYQNALGAIIKCDSVRTRPNFSPKNLCVFNLRQRVGSHFIRTGARYGAHSMIVRRSGIKKLLAFIKQYKVFLPYDMEYLLPPGMKLYSLNSPIIANQAGALTDNAYPGYMGVVQAKTQ